ncbi:hypothetical protein QCE81_33670, partial [Caballeronia sp. LZ002]|uniref:hypothetical protein n=1 Tax=Caballeronia sp. LZ002 TaxID=3038558 RepID=UPI00285CC8F8
RKFTKQKATGRIDGIVALAMAVGATQLNAEEMDNGFVAMKAARFINWKRRRTQAVQYITGVKYGAPKA